MPRKNIYIQSCPPPVRRMYIPEHAHKSTKPRAHNLPRVVCFVAGLISVVETPSLFNTPASISPYKRVALDQAQQRYLDLK